MALGQPFKKALMGTELFKEVPFLACLEVTTCTQTVPLAPSGPWRVQSPQFGIIRERGGPLNKLIDKFSPLPMQQAISGCLLWLGHEGVLSG